MTTCVQARRSVRWTRLTTLTTIVALSIAVGATRAEARIDDAARATTIVRMLRFVEWTAPAPGGDITIAVVGNSALGAALREACIDVLPRGRTVTVVDVASTRALAGVNASVVVLGAGTAPLARQLAAQGVLTVGDGDCPDHPELVLNLLADGNRFRFRANPTAAARAGVNLSSRLLRLAQIVN